MDVESDVRYEWCTVKPAYLEPLYLEPLYLEPVWFIFSRAVVNSIAL